MDLKDKHLLTLIETRIPVRVRPYADIAKTIGLDEAEVILKLHRLKSEGVIQSIQAFFDSAALGYRSVLTAMKILPDRFEEAVKIVNRHPGVYQSVQRDHEFNLWFSLGLPLGESFESHLAKLHELSGAHTSLVLPAYRTYRPSFSIFESSHDSDSPSEKNGKILPEKMPELSEQEMQMIQTLQQDIPLTDQPFSKIASTFGITQEALISRIRKWDEKGFFLGIRAVTPAQESVKSNSLIAWNVPEENRDTIGNQLVMFDTIRSCYARPAYLELPYSLYTGIDAETMAACEEIAKEVSRKIGHWPYRVLRNTKQLKNNKLKLFSSELHDWCRETGLALKPVRNENDALDKGRYSILGKQSLANLWR